MLTKGGKPVAELRPTEESVPIRLSELPALLAGLPHLEPDDAEQFARVLEADRHTLGPTPTPWAS